MPYSQSGLKVSNVPWEEVVSVPNRPLSKCVAVAPTFALLPFPDKPIPTATRVPPAIVQALLTLVLITRVFVGAALVHIWKGKNTNGYRP